MPHAVPVSNGGAVPLNSHRTTKRREQHMKHRIVVLGAGYAGAFTAGNLARRLSLMDAEITVVNAEPEFVQRLRLPPLAAGDRPGGPRRPAVPDGRRDHRGQR